MSTDNGRHVATSNAWIHSIDLLAQLIQDQQPRDHTRGTSCSIEPLDHTQST